LKISLLTGGDDPNYAFPLLAELILKKIVVDFIGNDEMQSAEIVRRANVNYLNLRGDQNPNASFKTKIIRVIRYYFKLMGYAAQTNSKLFHILWLNKFQYFDRTLLNIYYKLLGKKLVFTAHNINIGERDGNDSLLNRMTLKFMYKTVDHIFVHSKKMKLQLIENFNIKESQITVITLGINQFVKKTVLTSSQAKKKLSLEDNKKIILFFGRIAPYKGLKYLIQALVNLREKDDYSTFSRFRSRLSKEAINNFIFFEFISIFYIHHKFSRHFLSMNIFY